MSADLLHHEDHITIWANDLRDRGGPILRMAARRLREHEIPYFVTGGTLLGLVRDGGLIPTDTDVDISVLGEDVTEEQVMAAFADLPLARTVRFGADIQQIVFYPDDVILDIHFYRPDERGRISCRHVAGTLSFPPSVFARLVPMETRFGVIHAPENPEAYLAAKYGEDWRTPKHRKKGRYERT
jgi:hypothetical protein